VLLLGATGVSWLAALTGGSVDKSRSAIVIGTTGARCGVLTGSAGELALVVNKHSQSIPADAQLTLVDSCP
jgi:hypothetical protein